jgi:hypothetical protein
VHASDYTLDAWLSVGPQDHEEKRELEGRVLPVEVYVQVEVVADVLVDEIVQRLFGDSTYRWLLTCTWYATEINMFDRIRVIDEFIYPFGVKGLIDLLHL